MVAMTRVVTRVKLVTSVGGAAVIVALVAASCGGAAGGSHASGLPGNLGTVGSATAFPVAVSDLETTAKFAWAGGPAKTLVVARDGSNEVVWGAVSDGAGFSSPVTLNVLPAGATAKTQSMGGMIGGQTFVVVVELVDGKTGSQKFRLPASVGLGGSCTPESKATASFDHCDFTFADKGDMCTQFTGSAGENRENMRGICEKTLKGKYAEGPCRPSGNGACLSRCGAPNESLDTIYFATPPDWKKACDARKGTYVAP